MTDYFNAHEVLEQVEGLHSLSTLNKWANFIQKECGYSFHYDALPFASHTRAKRTINHRKTRLFSKEEIQKFQQVATLIPKIGRKEALKQLFDKQHTLNAMTHSELMAEMLEQVTLKWQEEWSSEWMMNYQRLRQQVQTLNNQLDQLKEQLSAQEQTSSGWFRRKR